MENLRGGTIVVNRQGPAGFDILCAVSLHSGISLEDLRGSSRKRRVAWVRQLAAYLMRRHCSHLSSSMTGRILGGKDHTTILAAQKIIAERLAHDGGHKDIRRLKGIHAAVLQDLGL